MNKDQATGLEPTILVIFGITGDLAKRKVLPALYHLLKHDLLPEHTAIVGTSRSQLTSEDLLKQVELCVLEADKVCDPEVIKKLRRLLTTLKFNPAEPSDYDQLLKTLNGIEARHGVCMNRLYYLSIPPSIYGPIVDSLGKHGLNHSCPHGNAKVRLLLEKPFGYDLASAKQLVERTSQSFSEEQLFRIDHYLAKETVQNILAFRKHNPLFASVWDNKHIQSISITAYEKVDIEGRVDFYEKVGALRDFVQNHLLQLLALTTMEMPADIMNNKTVHAHKQALLKRVKAVPANQVKQRVLRAQYKGYTQEVNNPNSTTETYVSLLLDINNDRWRGVPIYLATGKALSEKRTEIRIVIAGQTKHSTTNELVFRIQPDEGIAVALRVKTPGFMNALQTAMMDFRYQTSFGNGSHPDAYERVLIDAIHGEHPLFATAEEVLSSWRILQPVLDEWAKDASDLKTYPKGSTLQAVLTMPSALFRRPS
ncbi:MAG TPA: glucose-6-phosphate dehydrogenase [Candidatus Saccharimonadales bacterium]|nr:glucose-6-phosphate dehydrogenase [Candidatus Saccharimonadales bacterium]